MVGTQAGCGSLEARLRPGCGENSEFDHGQRTWPLFLGFPLISSSEPEAWSGKVWALLRCHQKLRPGQGQEALCPMPCGPSLPTSPSFSGTEGGTPTLQSLQPHKEMECEPWAI